MISGKMVFVFLLSQIATNVWWYCATQDGGLFVTPLILLAVMPTIILVLMFGGWIRRNWE